MDAENLHLEISYVGSSGIVLSTEQKTALQVSLASVKQKNNFRKIFFWGKIFGIKDDYYIIQGVTDDYLKNRKTLYSLNCMDWSNLTVEVTLKLMETASKVKGRFRGEPASEYEIVEEVQGEGEPESESLQIKEEERLACVIQMIDSEAAVVPRGAYKLTPEGSVLANQNYKGQELADASKLSSYFHFFPPENLHEKTLLAKANNDKAIDFLPAVEEDIPRGCWSIQAEHANNLVTIRSLWWPGLVGYNVINQSKFGYVYFGLGEKNQDLPFML
jgi:radial spoke head protein 9